MSDEKKIHGTLIPKDNRYAKTYATFYPDEQNPIATERYVNDKVADLINSAPEALDTLGELVNLTAGGTTGQVLTKRSNTDNDIYWVTPDARSSKPFKSGWRTSTTLADFCADVNRDAAIGEQYLGEVTCSGLPAGIGNAEVTAYKTGNNVVLLSLTSTNVAPYHWELSYLNGSLYGWRTMNVIPASSIPPASGGFRPNIVYNLGTLTGSQTFTLYTTAESTTTTEGVDSRVMNVYYWTFDTDSTPPTISSWPSQIQYWADGEAPTIEANMHYEISVMNGYATCLAFEKS